MVEFSNVKNMTKASYDDENHHPPPSIADFGSKTGGFEASDVSLFFISIVIEKNISSCFMKITISFPLPNTMTEDFAIESCL